MGEEVTSIVKATSDGKVVITLEAYQDLLAKAAEKPPVVHRTVHKTPEVAASENKAWGVTMMGLGAALVALGAVRFSVGVKQAAKLVKN
jgi:hypothetical protein